VQKQQEKRRNYKHEEKQDHVQLQKGGRGARDSRRGCRRGRGRQRTICCELRRISSISELLRHVGLYCFLFRQSVQLQQRRNRLCGCLSVLPEGRFSNACCCVRMLRSDWSVQIAVIECSEFEPNNIKIAILSISAPCPAPC
jgi:hypothetical protein